MYVCSKCGGRNVEALSWVDLNSGEVDDSDSVGEFYCRDCGSHTEVDYQRIDDEIDLDGSINPKKNIKPLFE